MLHPSDLASRTGGDCPNLTATALASVLREAAGIACAPFDRPPPRA